MKAFLASTSTLFGEDYLMYLKDILTLHFKNIFTILFIPYAQPNGISYDDYTQKAQSFFTKIDKKIIGLHTFDNPKKAIENAEAIFVGGGNTFLLLKTIYDLDLLSILKQKVENGTPYLGCSAGSNIAGKTIKTTNDMPIVYPKKLDALNLIPFHINPHYLDPIKDLKHNGESRETRILEFLSQNPKEKVIGLREGSWLEINDKNIHLRGNLSARIFENNNIYELETNFIIT